MENKLDPTATIHCRQLNTSWMLDSVWTQLATQLWYHLIIFDLRLISPSLDLTCSCRAGPSKAVRKAQSLTSQWRRCIPASLLAKRMLAFSHAFTRCTRKSRIMLFITGLAACDVTAQACSKRRNHPFCPALSNSTARTLSTCSYEEISRVHSVCHMCWVFWPCWSWTLLESWPLQQIKKPTAIVPLGWPSSRMITEETRTKASHKPKESQWRIGASLHFAEKWATESAPPSLKTSVVSSGQLHF